MCGIVAYSGSRSVQSILVNGLRRLEYRGYDSSGICVQVGKHLELVRAKGKLTELENVLNAKPVESHVGIGHTRWATHGAPSVMNAHPHMSMDGKIAVVHNGIIENYAIIKERLQKEGVVFKSETDTEVIVHLISKFYRAHTETGARRLAGRRSERYVASPPSWRSFWRSSVRCAVTASFPRWWSTER